jgi:hypothetical protein
MSDYDDESAGSSSSSSRAESPEVDERLEATATEAAPAETTQETTPPADDATAPAEAAAIQSSDGLHVSWTAPHDDADLLAFE